MIAFEGWPKTPRLFRDMVVTEKIDGTNAAVIVEPAEGQDWDADAVRTAVVDGVPCLVGAQSRKRLITPADDNFGFARWVFDNAESLARVLGPGRHFGEWWGSGIQRGYGLTSGEKRFSLFNVNRYADVVQEYSDHNAAWLGLDVVPTLYTGPFALDEVTAQLAGLVAHGSLASPGFDRPEGVVVYHTAAGQVFKALIENDDTPKGNG